MTEPRENSSGWYVIQNPHRNNARVILGPTSKREAARYAALATERASIIHTPGLLRAVQRDGLRVSWEDTADRPASLEVARA